MMRFQLPMKLAIAAGLAVLAGGPTAAQLLPPISAPGDAVGGLGRTVTGALEDTVRAAEPVAQTARSLASARAERLGLLVREHGDRLEMTEQGPAVRGEIIAIAPSPATLLAAQQAGFVILGDEEIEGLGIRSVSLRPPDGHSLRRALRRLQRIAPDGEFAANHLHFQSGAAPVLPVATPLAAQAGGAGTPIGIIDGGVAAHAALAGTIVQRGFARGAPAAHGHATAIASLLVGRGAVRGAAGDARLLVADVYGRDPAGGNAAAIARALGWMVQQRVPVVAVSLVGPRNALVERAIGAARARGLHIVAAVGNDGPAAPPAYPASYPGVIAVTGVDGRNRVLIEAGRSLHLDYAAPGADMLAASAGGGAAPVRGTSFAVPFVAARLWHAIAGSRSPLAALDGEAVDLAPRGPDRRSGRGLLCGDCRTPVRRN